MSKGHEIKFRIGAFTPDTMPMARLAEYMQEYAGLLGDEAGVHFKGLRKGSCLIVARVDDDKFVDVRQRISLCQSNNAPKDLAERYRKVDGMLREDRTSGSVVVAGMNNVLRFPGARAPGVARIGPIREAGAVEGELVRVGGRDDTKHAQLVSADGESYKLSTRSKDMARELGKYLFAQIRVFGVGTWYRAEDHAWKLKLTVERFETIADQSVTDAIDALRAVPGSEWRDFNDPLSAVLTCGSIDCMSVVFDTSALVLAIDAGAEQCQGDPGTGEPVTDVQARYDYLLRVLGQAKTKICIPAPVPVGTACRYWRSHQFLR